MRTAVPSLLLLGCLTTAAFLSAQRSDLPARPDLSRADPAVRESFEALFEALENASGEERPPLLSRLGAAFLAHEFLEASVETLRISLEARPRWSDGYHYLGYALAKLGRFEEAKDAFERCLEIEPDRTTTIYRLALVERELGSDSRALDLLERVLERSPDSAAAHQSLGELLLEQGAASQAIPHLEKALELAPAANRLHYSLSRAYRSIGELDRARLHLASRGSVGAEFEDEAIARLQTLESGVAGPLLRGRRAYAAGRFEEAVVEFSAALEAAQLRKAEDPRLAGDSAQIREEVSVRLNLAAALGEAGRADAAIEQLESALERDPNRPRALSNLATLHLTQGNDAAAYAALERAVALAPRDAVIRELLFRSLVASGDYQRALEHSRVALEASPEKEALWLDEHRVLVAAGRLEEALARLEEASRLLPNAGLIAHALARFLATASDLQLRDGPRAVELAEAVVRVAPSPSHRQTLVFALAESGRCDEAVALQKDAVTSLSARAASQEDRELLERQEALLQHLAEQRPCRLTFG